MKANELELLCKDSTFLVGINVEGKCYEERMSNLVVDGRGIRIESNKNRFFSNQKKVVVIKDIKFTEIDHVELFMARNVQIGTISGRFAYFEFKSRIHIVLKDGKVYQFQNKYVKPLKAIERVLKENGVTIVDPNQHLSYIDESKSYEDLNAYLSSLDASVFEHDLVSFTKLVAI